MTKQNGRYQQFTNWGRSGTVADVDRLMQALNARGDFATTRLVDFALGLVATDEGATRVTHYLFHGSSRQRNYAALYLKRRGDEAVLDEAVAQGKIDVIQAYAK